jgi:hypothetical protein
LLYPEIKKAKRLKKSESIDLQMQKLIEIKKCTCGGELKQARKGSIIAYCKKCNNRFKATNNKKK